MPVDLAPTDVELITRVVRAYGLVPAASDRPAIDHVLEVLTPILHEAHTDAVS